MFQSLVSECTWLQKSAVIKFWKLKAKLGIDDEGNLQCESKRVVTKFEIKKIVTKTFVLNTSGGHRKIQVRAANRYAGVSKKEILKVTNNNGKFMRFNALFTNKAVLKPVRAKKVPSFLCLDCKY